MSKSIRKQYELPAQVAPSLGGIVVYDVPLTADMERLIINFTGTVTLATASATSLKKSGISELIQSVDLIANGAITIASLPFHQLVDGNLFRRFGKNTYPVSQPALTVGANAFSAIGVLDLSSFGALRPKDSSVRETNYKTLQLKIRFAGDFTGVYNLGTATVSGSTLAMQVVTEETVEMVNEKGHVSSPIFLPQFSYREDTVTGATLRERFRLTPDQALRGLTLRAVEGTNTLNSDTVLSRVRLYTGTTLRLELSAAAIRARNLAEMSAAVPTGFYYLNLAGQGATPDRLNDCYDLRNAILNGADAYLEYDSLAAMTLGVTQWGLVGTKNGWASGAN